MLASVSIHRLAVKLTEQSFSKEPSILNICLLNKPVGRNSETVKQLSQKRPGLGIAKLSKKHGKDLKAPHHGPREPPKSSDTQDDPCASPNAGAKW